MAAVVLTCVAAAAGVYAETERLKLRNYYIASDFTWIHDRFGGTTEGNRLLQIKFIREWEYVALKETKDGKGVWLHITLSKRHCGNLMLTDHTQNELIRPFRERHPEGIPPEERPASLCIRTS